MSTFATMMILAVFNGVAIAAAVGTEKPWLIAGASAYSAWWLMANVTAIIEKAIKERDGLPK